MGQIWDFFWTVFSTSQNIIKSDLIPFGGNMTHNWPKSDTPAVNTSTLKLIQCWQSMDVLCKHKDFLLTKYVSRYVPVISHSIDSTILNIILEILQVIQLHWIVTNIVYDRKLIDEGLSVKFSVRKMETHILKHLAKNGDYNYILSAILCN